jgi:outer membrane protein OmpA-like peptidoglycan-associated protein
VKIDGYTDAVGNDAYNLDLSNRRAAAVQQALQALVGSSSVQFGSAGHGKADPVAPNANPDGSDNPAGRARNRRVTIAFPK